MKKTNGNEEITALWEEMLKQKASVLTEISLSGQSNAKLRNLTDWLRRELDLEARYNGLLADAERLVMEQRKHVAGENAQEYYPTIVSSEDKTSESHNQQAGKEAAHGFRSAYLAREKSRGEHLSKTGRIYYQTDEGVILGMTFATEKKSKRESTWFLNLKHGSFHEAVLLCQVASDQAQVIHLSRNFIDKFIQKFSRDEKGMIKFNLARRDGKFWLQIPEPTGWVNVEEFNDGTVESKPAEYA